MNIKVAVIMSVLVDFMFSSVWQINDFAYSGNRHGKSIGGRAFFFVSDNAVLGSCLSFISQYNCLVTKLLQGQHTISVHWKENCTILHILKYAETTANVQDTKCSKSLKSPKCVHSIIR